MKNQEIKNSKSIELIINTILNIDLPKWEHFAKEKPIFDIPQNANTGNFYNGCNQLILMFNTIQKGFTSPFYLPVSKAVQLSADFKGQKTTEVLKFAPIFKHKETGKTISEQKYKALTDDKKDLYKKTFLFRTYLVLNLDQLANYDEIDKSSLILEAPTFEKDFDLNEKAETFIKNVINNKGLILEKKRSFKAFYSPLNDFVCIPKEEIFKDDISLYSTTFHELIHWTGHESRLNRFEKDFTNDDSKTGKYAFEELVAEMGALLLCNEFNLYESFSNSCQYLAGWLMSIKGHKQVKDMTEEEVEEVKENARETLSKAFAMATEAKDFLIKN